VFDVQNGKATDLANALNDILSLSGSYYESSSQSGHSPAPTAPTTRSTTTSGNNGVVDGMKIVPNEETNSLLILATAEEFASLERTLKRLDVEPIQVLLEASLAEVTLNDALRFGLQWSYQSEHGPLILSEARNGAVQPQFPGFSYLYAGRQDIQAVLNTLETLTDVDVVSSPKLLVLNNHQAELQVGDEVPIATQTAVSTVGSSSPIVNSIQMRDTGVILQITPRVNKNGLVLLDIDQEVSEVVATTSSTIDSPTIQKRRMSSSIAVHDGETIALGGLIRDSRTKTREGIPLLWRIPVLGALFGSVDRNRRRTELIVLITPRVIRSGKEAATMMEELRDEFRKVRKAMPP
jgi:general secretion pathway protein D